MTRTQRMEAIRQFNASIATLPPHERKRLRDAVNTLAASTETTVSDILAAINKRDELTSTAGAAIGFGLGLGVLMLMGPSWQAAGSPVVGVSLGLGFAKLFTSDQLTNWVYDLVEPAEIPDVEITPPAPFDANNEPEWVRRSENHVQRRDYYYKLGRTETEILFKIEPGTRISRPLLGRLVDSRGKNWPGLTSYTTDPAGNQISSYEAIQREILRLEWGSGLVNNVTWEGMK